MKKVLLVLLFLLLSSSVFALDTFPVSFHSSGFNESISLDLVRYLKHPGPFKHTPVENVRVVIEEGIATISPIDPDWMGIEDIVFAPIGVELEAPELKNETQKLLERRNVTVSREEIDAALGPLIDQSFFVLAGGLSGEQINISGFLGDDSLELDINDELSLNISSAEDSRSLSPSFMVDIHDQSKDLSLAEYSEPYNWLFLFVVLFLVFSCIVVFAYFYTGYAQGIFSSIVTQESKHERQVVLHSFKRKALQELLAVKGKLPKGNAKQELKAAKAVLDEFFRSCLHTADVSRGEILERLEKRGVGRSLRNEVGDLYDDYAAMQYGKKKISRQSVSSFVAKAHSVMHSL